jgi:putative phage-type endonuclease
MKSIEIPGLVQGSDEWRRWRDTGIGGSDAPLIGLPEGEDLYGKTALSLWREKMGYSQAQFNAQAQEHTKRGHELEPAARAEFIRRTGIWVEPVCMQSATHPFMLASMDGMNAARDVGVEIKAPAKKMFEEMLKKGTLWYYADQVQHQIFVSGAREFYFWAYNPEVEPYIFIERHEPNHARIQELVRREREFWRHVELGVAPGSELGVGKATVGKLGLTMFAGYAKVGKDTAGLVHSDLFSTKRYGFADALKETYSAMNKTSLLKIESEKEKHRPGLVALGHGMRGVDPEVWVNGIFNGRTGIYEAMVDMGAIITDCRYVNEASHGRKHAERLGVPFRLVWVEKPGVGPANEMERDFTSLLKPMADIVLVNDMNIKDPVGAKALEIAVVWSMSVVPKGKANTIHASSFQSMAFNEVKASEPKRKKDGGKAGIKRSTKRR